MKLSKSDIIISAVFILIPIILFRVYIFKGQVPFPANLLVSYYQPWVSYPDPAYPNGPPNKPLGFDNLRIFYPLRELTSRVLKQFQVPLWNPYYFAGNTLLATYQSAVFHPMSWLFLIFSQIDAWSIIIMLEPLLVAIFTYLFLRSMGYRRLVGVFGAFTFALSGFMIVWFEESFMSVYTALSLPLILWAIEKLKEKITGWRFLLLIIGLVWSVVSGWFQMTFYVWIFTFCWVIYEILTKKVNLKLFKIIGLAAILSLAVSSVQLIPGFEMYRYSARGTTDVKFLFDSYLVPIWHLVTLLAPDFFGNPATYNYTGLGFYYERMVYFGIIPLIFTLYALILPSKKNHSLFYKLAFLISLSLGISLPTSWFLLYYLKLPFVSVIIPSRIFFISTFAGSILAAEGMDFFIQKVAKRRLLFVLVSMAFVLIGMWGFILWRHYVDPKGMFGIVNLRNLIIPTSTFIIGVILIWFAARYSKRQLQIIGLLILISVLTSIIFANKYLYFSDRKFLYPQTPVTTELKKLGGINRFWSFGVGFINTNFAIPFGLYSSEGYDSFFIARYGELVYAGQHHGKYNPQISRADAVIAYPDRIDKLLNDPGTNRLLSLLNVKYILGLNKPPKDVSGILLPPEDLVPRWTDGKYTIYQYSQAYPRVYLAGDYRVEQNSAKILKLLFDPSFDPRKTIILEEQPTGFTAVDKINGSANITDYGISEVKISVTTDKNALLFLSDNYFPGWKAYIDGKLTRVYRADYTFRAVVMPVGHHTVIFRYEPFSWTLAKFVTGGGLILLFLLITFWPKNRPKKLK